MAKNTDIRILEVHCSFEPYKFRTPLSFGGRVQQGSELINVEIKVESRNGKHAIGFGSMPMGNVWAWPSETVTPDQTAAAIKQFARELIEIAEDFPEFAHPLETMYRISGEYTHLGQKISRQMKLAEPMPPLAELVAASPFDAALHDAFGRAHSQNSYNLLGKEFVATDLSEYLDASFKGEYLDKYTLREPKPRMPLYHLVGALDPLSMEDVTTKVGDRLPECLADWIAAEGLTHLKIKLGSGDLQADLDRTLAVDKVATEAQAKRNVSNWFYSLDFNEKCPDVGFLLEFLKKLKAASPAAYERIQYIEQPTHRDLKGHPDQKVHEAAQLKPVVIDESLADYETLLLAREMGYSGVALKACKGHSDALLIAAAAQKMGLFLCVQDLTCPGFSFLHSASLAARIPTVTAIEGNARQYSPSMNRQWRTRFPGMFDIKDGTVNTSLLNGVGLGFD
ncbi:MAG: mandelate racemase/muconate lactonizing enzyme family protein [Planctomycetales bacterium]